MATMSAGELAERAWQRLRSHGVGVEAGLSDVELDRIEHEYGFGFAPVHRAFLGNGLPRGDGWPDWRHDDQHEALAAPVEGVLFDVAHNGFWWPAWGRRPDVSDATSDATETARLELARVPQLIPIYRHRYLPAAPAPEPTPVLSVVQTDVVRYGRDLGDYLEREFGARRGPVTDAQPVPFWTELDRTPPAS